MYILKSIPEDFKVTELHTETLQESGKFQIVELVKKDFTSEKAVMYICKANGISRRAVHYAGKKDKKALTTQWISIKGRTADVSINSEDISVSVLGYLDEPVGLGRHAGNHFDIVIRNIDKKPNSISYFANYFDTQRFSTQNPTIGKCIVQKKFSEAVRLISESDSKIDDLNVSGDPIRELKKLPPTFLSLYVHSYQAYLWNTVVSRFLEGKELADYVDFTIPLIGFDVEYPNSEVEELYEDLLSSEGISERDFIIRQIENLSAEGGNRKVVSAVEHLVIGELVDDELHSGMKKCTVSFDLEPGSYATEMVKSLGLD